MKRIIAITICLILIVSLTACKSDEAKRVDKMIEDIGTVTLDSEEAITEAEKEVEGLEPEDREQLDNEDLLKEKHEEYTVLVYKSQAKTVDDLITAIGEVDLSSAEDIKKARTAYDELSEETKEYVNNYNLLEEAENKLIELQADEVIKLINDIGDVNENSEEKIKKAEEAYSALSSEAKEKVTNYSTLTSARTNYDNLVRQNKLSAVKEEMETELSKLDIETDTVAGYSWYLPYNRPTYVNERVYVLPFIGNNQNNDDWYLCLIASYYGDDWIFYNKLVINADGQRYERSLDYSKIERSNKKGLVAEFFRQPIKDSDITWLRAIAESDNAVIRFQGSSHQYDLTVSSTDKQSIKQVLDTYDIVLQYKELK